MIERTYSIWTFSWISDELIPNYELPELKPIKPIHWQHLQIQILLLCHNSPHLTRLFKFFLCTSFLRKCQIKEFKILVQFKVFLVEIKQINKIFPSYSTTLTVRFFTDTDGILQSMEDLEDRISNFIKRIPKITFQRS